MDIMKIEDTIFQMLPVNTIPILDRILELLKENKTNSITMLKNKDTLFRFQVQSLLWLLNEQFYGSNYKIDQSYIWNKLFNEFNNKLDINRKFKNE